MESIDLLTLFKKGEDLQNKMRIIFKKNNLLNSEIQFLPKEDFEIWKNLHEESVILTKKISSHVEKNQ